MATAEIQPRTKTVTDVSQLFMRVLVGADGSPESVEAARQAALLIEPGGTLSVLAAWTVPAPVVVGYGPTYSTEIDADFYRGKATGAAAEVKNGIAGLTTARTKVVRGTAWEALVNEIEQDGDALVVVGSHGQGRMRGIVMGSTATEIVHKAPCSVLVARPAEQRFPRRIVVGVDGSPESAFALAAACRVAARFGSELWPVVAHGGKGVDHERVAAVVDYHHEDLPTEPVPALVAASADADLVIVGSRGLHGFKALGSVSERVAHRAHCSTLIVRAPIEMSTATDTA